MRESPLLEVLKDGRFHSGEELGAAAGMSRSAIWKAVQRLNKDGILIDSVKGKGYRIPGGLDLLSREAVLLRIVGPARDLLRGLDVFDRVDSTNEVALSRARSSGCHGVAILAEQQSAGRGRRGRHWVSPFGANIYLSLVWEFEGGAAAIEGLSLAVGVALCRALGRLGAEQAGLKWPNDLVLHGKKAGGVLIELNGDLSGRCQAIIGVGLNMRMPTAAADAIDQPWIDLCSCGLATLSRNEVAASVLSELLGMLGEFQRAGLSAFLEEWRQLDVLRERPVVVRIGDVRVSGRAEGINGHGALLVRTADDRVQEFAGGEVSLRGANDPVG